MKLKEPVAKYCQTAVLVSVKGAYYLKNSTGVDVNLKPLSKIVQEETN